MNDSNIRAQSMSSTLSHTVFSLTLQAELCFFAQISSSYTIFWELWSRSGCTPKFFFTPLRRTNSIETIALKEVRNNLRCCSSVKILENWRKTPTFSQMSDKWSIVTQINTRFSLELRKQHWNCRFHTVFGFSLTINNSRLTEYGNFPQQLCCLHHQLPSHSGDSACQHLFPWTFHKTTIQKTRKHKHLKLIHQQGYPVP